MGKILDDYDRIYHKQTLNSIVKYLYNNENEEISTASFEFIQPRIWSLVGRSNRPFLRKCLRTLEHDGFLENINKGFNIHYWKLTDKGRLYYKQLNK